MSPPTHLPPVRRFLARVLRIGVLTGIGVCSLQVSHALAQATRASVAAVPASDTAMQALFLYNFAKFVEWPDKVFASQQSPITLCIYGEKPSEIRQAVAVIDGKTAQGREVKARRTATLAELNDCQIVFVPSAEKRWLPEVLRVAHAASALTVSDMDDFIDTGGGIGLLIVDQQVRFEFNLDAMQAAHLKVSAQLLKLARTVKGQGARN